MIQSTFHFQPLTDDVVNLLCNWGPGASQDLKGNLKGIFQEKTNFRIFST